VENYEQLKTRLETMLRRPRPLKPQSERQLQQYLAEHNSSLPQLLLCAADILEEYELDIVFGPLFTPDLDDRIELADLLLHWKPTSAQIAQLVPELCARIPHVPVRLPDGTEAQLSLHPVMVERFVRLLRLDSAANSALARTVTDSLPPQLAPIAVALMCETGMIPPKQHWFAMFVQHLAARGPQSLSRGLLETVAEFIASQAKLDREQLLASARALRVATESTAVHASSGHAYWSPDVAQHHQYRGQGHVDVERAERNQAELERVNAMVDELEKFEYVTSDE
jgi:hypothetical protein